jgi:hypothetical protein
VRPAGARDHRSVRGFAGRAALADCNRDPGQQLTTAGAGLDHAIWSDPLAVTAPGGRTSPQAEVAASGQIQVNAALTAGSWPGPPRPGQPIPVALPETAAAELGVVPGDLLASRDRNTGAGLLRTVVRSEGITALVATHDTDLMDLADDVLRLEDGRLAG